MNDNRETIRRLVIAMNNFGKAYSACATKMGSQESELWLMYALDDSVPHSQKQICDEWGFPRTTLNSITKKCEAAGYLTLSPIPGKRREMTICLTESGKEYTKKLLDVVYRAERSALEETLKRYSAEFISALDYFGQCIKSSFEKEFEQE